MARQRRDLARWLAGLAERERILLRKFGKYASAQALARVLGWTEVQVDLARRYLNVQPGRQVQHYRRPRFSYLFESFHGRAARLDDYPPPAWLPGKKRYRWSEPEEDLLRSLYGIASIAEIAGQLSRLLQRLTGDRSARRLPAEINSRAGQLQIDGRYNGRHGIIARQAARTSGISYNIIHDVIAKGELQTIGTGKYRYIPWASWTHWRDAYLAKRAEQQRQVDALPEPCIGTLAAMRRLGINETHLGRWLKGEVLRGWYIGDKWYIAKQSVEQVRRDRKAGKDVLNTPAYERVRKIANASHRQLRRRQRTEAGHTVKVPFGYQSPVAVAFEAGVAPSGVYSAIQARTLKAVPRPGGGLMITRREARRFIREVKTNPSPHLRRERRLRRRIHALGCLTNLETAQALGVKLTQVGRYVRAGKLHPIPVANRVAYNKQEVLALKRMRATEPKPNGRTQTVEAHRPAGYLTTSELKQTLGISQNDLSQRIDESVVRPKVVFVGRSKLQYFSPSQAGKLRRWYIANPPDPAWRRITNIEAIFKRKGLWSSRRSARHLRVKTATVTQYAYLGTLKPSARIRNCLGFRPTRVRAYAKSRRGGSARQRDFSRTRV